MENIGFEHRTPGLGGGGGEIVNHILAYLSVDTNREAIVNGLLTNIVWEALKLIYKYHRNNCINLEKAKPSVNVYIYSENKTKNYFINININEEKSKEEVGKIVKSSTEKNS